MQTCTAGLQIYEDCQQRRVREPRKLRPQEWHGLSQVTHRQLSRIPDSGAGRRFCQMTLYLANAAGGASQLSQIVASPMLFSDAGYIQVFMLHKGDGPAESIVKLDLLCPLRQRDQLLPCPEAISSLAAHVVNEKNCSLFAPDMATKFSFVAGGNSVTVHAEYVPELGPEMPFTCAFLNSVGPGRRYIVDADSDLTPLLMANVLYGVWRNWSKVIVTSVGMNKEDVLDGLE